jgi:hypothetical protein
MRVGRGLTVSSRLPAGPPIRLPPAARICGFAKPPLRAHLEPHASVAADAAHMGVGVVPRVGAGCGFGHPAVPSMPRSVKNLVLLAGEEQPPATWSAVRHVVRVARTSKTCPLEMLFSGPQRREAGDAVATGATAITTRTQLAAATASRRSRESRSPSGCVTKQRGARIASRCGAGGRIHGRGGR